MSETLALSIYDCYELVWRHFSVYAKTEACDGYEVFEQPEVHDVGSNLVEKGSNEILKIAVSVSGIPFALRGDGKKWQLSDEECLLDNVLYTTIARER